MDQPLTPEQAQAVFNAMAALDSELHFLWLEEGCECRAALMIEQMQAMGLTPGRAWAIAVGRSLSVPQPNQPGHSFKWFNHVAPTVKVQGAEHGVLVIDPSLSRTGPLTLIEWAGAMRAGSIEVSSVGLSQAEILNCQAARALQGLDFDAMIFNLRMGEPPIPELGGTGFCIGPDPKEVAGVFARKMMRHIRNEIARRSRS
jgi:hypothetical protein